MDKMQQHIDKWWESKNNKTHDKHLRIIVKKRYSDWIAFIDANGGIWKCGRSDIEAIVKLIVTLQEEMGIKLRWHGGQNDT